MYDISQSIDPELIDLAETLGIGEIESKLEKKLLSLISSQTKSIDIRHSNLLLHTCESVTNKTFLKINNS